MFISGLLKKRGHTVDVFIASGNDDDIIGDIAAFKPDIIGFSCTTGIHKWALQFAEKMRRRVPGKVLFGGPHATYFPEVIQEPAVDIICRGEGEGAVLELADRIDRGVALEDTANFWFKVDGKIIRNPPRPLINDLNELAFPDRDLYLQKYPFLNKSQKMFFGGRGCPFKCTFCFNHAFLKLYKGKGKVVRYRSVENVIEEIKEVRRNYGMKNIYMIDDTFILNKNWLLNFCEKYQTEVGLPFACQVRADLADEEIIRRLSEAGCTNVFFGVEVGSETLRNSLLKKEITDDDIKRLAKLLKKYHIKFRTYNMLGLPGETLAEAFKTMDLNAEIGTDYPWCSIFHPFPGTELAEYAKVNNLLETSIDDAAPSFFKDSIIKSEYKNEIVNLQKLFFYGVKFPWITPLIKRLIRFKPNIFLDLAFLVGYGWCYIRSEKLTLGEVASIGKNNLRSFFFS